MHIVAMNHMPAVTGTCRIMYFVVAVSQSNWFVAIKGHDLQRGEKNRFISHNIDMH